MVPGNRKPWVGLVAGVLLSAAAGNRAVSDQAPPPVQPDAGVPVAASAAPVVSFTYADNGLPIPVRVSFSGATACTLFYAPAGATDYQELKLLAVDDGWSGSVPPVNGGALRYYVVCCIGGVSAPMRAPALGCETYMVPVSPGERRYTDFSGWVKDTNAPGGTRSTNFYRTVSGGDQWLASAVLVGATAGAKPAGGVSPFLYMRNVRGTYFRTPRLDEGVGTISFSSCMANNHQLAQVLVQVTTDETPGDNWQTVATNDYPVGVSLTGPPKFAITVEVNRRDVRYVRLVRTRFNDKDDSGTGITGSVVYDNFTVTRPRVDMSEDGDGDGLTGLEEQVLGTDSRRVDSDGDGLSDRMEVQWYGTHPADSDSDDDGLTDGAEISAYRVAVEPTAWTDLPAEALSLREMLEHGEDDGAVTVFLPFYFESRWCFYDVADIGVNGLIEFGTSVDGYSPCRNEALPCPWVGPLVAAFWDDLYVCPGVSDILCAFAPAGASTAFVVEWRDVVRLGDPESTRLTFQVVLEPTGVIRANYRDLAGPAADGASATLGMQGAEGEGALLYACNRTGTVFSGLSLVYVPVAATDALNPDTDCDGLPDGWEHAHGLDPVSAADAAQDADNDGLSALSEYAAGTDPRDADGDDDGIRDGWELANGFNPFDWSDAAGDADCDGVSNLCEYERGTNPHGIDVVRLLSLSGPVSGAIGENLTYTATATNNCGHAMKYRFAWDSAWTSAWSDANSAVMNCSAAGAHVVSVQACCAAYPGVVSSWSAPAYLVIRRTPVVTFAAADSRPTVAVEVAVDDASACTLCYAPAGSAVFHPLPLVLRGSTWGATLPVVDTGCMRFYVQYVVDGQTAVVWPNAAPYPTYTVPSSRDERRFTDFTGWERDTSALGGAKATNFYRTVTGGDRWQASGVLVGATAGAKPAGSTKPFLFLRNITGVWFCTPRLDEGAGTIAFASCMSNNRQLAQVLVQISTNETPGESWQTVAVNDYPAWTGPQAMPQFAVTVRLNRRDVRYVRLVRTIIGYQAYRESDIVGAVVYDNVSVSLPSAISGEDDDGDGLSNDDEHVAGVDAQCADTDGDGLSDGAEVLTHGTDPQSADSDRDRLPDGWEIQQRLNPIDPVDAEDDDDGDGLSTFDEWERGTAFRCADTDGDGLSDGTEALIHGTDPLTADSDHDGLSDADEVQSQDRAYSVSSGETTATVLGEDATQVRMWVCPDTMNSATVQDGFSSVPVGFDFPCGGTLSSSVRVGVHGVISIDGRPTEPRNEGLPSQRLPATAIMPMWDDLVLRAGGGVRYAMIGAFPDRHLVVEWHDASRYETPDTRLTFQALLYESGRIEYRYLQAEGPCSDGVSATIGVQVADPPGRACYADRTAGSVVPGRYVRFEPSYATSPVNADSDGDGMPDGWETECGLNPLAAWDAWYDQDGDGMSALFECIHGSHPLFTDTDQDGLSDTVENLVLFSNPAVPDPELAAADSDGDGLSNAEESAYGLFINGYDDASSVLCSPMRWDSDGDGLYDGDEVYYFGSSPAAIDTDRDGLTDLWEILHGYNPADPADGGGDADGDGLSDACEVVHWHTSPFDADSDGDGMTDDVEYLLAPQLLATRNDLTSDIDGDGICNMAEFLAGTDGQVWDTDGDAASDGQELACGLDPLDPDDGLRDSDGDRVPDVFERAWGANPHDAQVVPETPFVARTADALAQTITAALAAPREHCALVQLLPGVTYGPALIPGHDAALCVYVPAGAKARITPGATAGGQTSCLSYSSASATVFAGITFDVLGGQTCVQVDGRGRSVFRDCVFTGGKPRSSGLVRGSDYGSLSFENSAFSGNTLNTYNGETVALVWAAAVQFSHCTFVANTNRWPSYRSSLYGVMVARGPALCRNSIVWNNPDVTPGAAVLDGSNLVDVDPCFESGSLQLSWRSPCIGRGTGMRVPYDAVGLPRIEPADLGAYESVGLDFDGDRLPDEWERCYGLPTNAPSDSLDADGDGLAALVEFKHHTNPTRSDTDADGLSDPVEISQTGTRPDVADTDADGLADQWEVAYGTNPFVSDATADPDGDGVPNWREAQRNTHPNRADSDGDGLVDGWELAHGFDPTAFDAAGQADPDGDGIDSSAESKAGTDHLSADTDHDGLDDGAEAAAGTDPRVADTDGDGLTDGAECAGSAAYTVLALPTMEWVPFGEDAHWITDWLMPEPECYDFNGVECADDAYAPPINFDLVIGTNLFRTVHVSPNGLVALGSRFASHEAPLAAPHVNSQLPVGGGQGVLAAFWGDLAVRVADGVWWSTNAVDGVPRLVVTWECAATRWEFSSALYIQAEYRADTRAIVFRYGQAENSTFPDGASATIGVQGTDGKPVARFCNNRAGAVQPGMTLTFLPAVTDPLRRDTDRDGLTDGFEVGLGSDPTVADAAADADGDGLTFAQEVYVGSDPFNADSDGDGFSDGEEELRYAMSARVPLDPAGDEDGDGLSNWEEYCYRTIPRGTDTDCDGVSDGAEVAQGSDPTDGTDGGQAPPAGEVVDIQIQTADDETGVGAAGMQVTLGRIRHRSYAAGVPYSATYRLRRGVSLAVGTAFVRPSPTGFASVNLMVDGQAFEWREGCRFTAGSAILDDPQWAFLNGYGFDTRQNALPTATLTLPRVRILNVDGTPLAGSACGRATVQVVADVQPPCAGTFSYGTVPDGRIQGPTDTALATVIIPDSGVTVGVTFMPTSCVSAVACTVDLGWHRSACSAQLTLPGVVLLNSDNDCSTSRPDLDNQQIGGAEDDLPVCGPNAAFCCGEYARRCRVSVTRDAGGPPVGLWQDGWPWKVAYALPDTIPADQVEPFRIEGLRRSGAVDDVRYTMTLQRPGLSNLVCHAATTVMRVDVDADFTGDGRVNADDPDDPEEGCEPGAPIDTSTGRMVQLRAKAWLPVCPSDGRLSLAAYGAHVRLWDGEDRRTATCVLNTADALTDNDKLVWSVPQFGEFENGSDYTACGKAYWIDGAESGAVEFRLTYEGSQILQVDRVIASVASADITPDFDRDGKIDDTDRERMVAREVFRIWVNDDRDIGDDAADAEDDSPLDSYLTTLREEVASRTPNCRDAVVNGTRDLVDFFPLRLELPLERFPPQTHTYTIRQKDAAVNLVLTALKADDVRAIHTRSVISGCGGTGDFSATNAPSLQVTSSGVVLPVSWLVAGHTVILIEGRARTTQPLVLEISVGGRVVCACAMGLSVSPVWDMIRYLNARTCDSYFTAHTTRQATRGKWLTKLTEPPNYPDGFYNPPGEPVKTLIVVHGLDWDETESPAGNAELFKRFFQSGLNARFVGVSWASDLSRRFGLPIIYANDVIGAFVAAPWITRALTDFAGSNTAVFAHSLGNMLVSSAIQDHGLRVGQYFMVNGAVPVEAYDGRADVPESQRMNMVPPDWKNTATDPPSPSFGERVMCAGWSTLFTGPDPRTQLTWSGRFGDVTAMASLKVHQFYSSGEEILREPGVTLPEVLDWPAASSDSVAGARECVWAYHEMTKGSGRMPAVYLPGHSDAGWGFNEDYDTVVSMWDVISQRMYETIIHLDAASANCMLPEALIAKPVFRRFSAAADVNVPGWPRGSDWLCRPDGDADVAASLPFGFLANQSMVKIKNHAKIMAETMPPLSGAAGSCAAVTIMPSCRYDVNVDLKNPLLWPMYRLKKSRNQMEFKRWLHGDYKDLAYLYVHGLYDKVAEGMGKVGARQ